LEWHGALDHKETTISSVARERKQSNRKSAESMLKSCGADVIDCNRHRMTVAGEEVTDQEKADEHDATDHVVEALEDIVDRSKKQKTETFDSNAAASLPLPLWFGSTCAIGAMHRGDSADVSENLQDSFDLELPLLHPMGNVTTPGLIS
jgi:hypothetical protein